MKLTQDAKLLIGVGIVTGIVALIAAFTIGNKPVPGKGQEILGEQQIKLLLRSDTHMTGPKKSNVSIVEFGDFQCPACGVAYGIVKQIEKEYKGKVNFAFREFPLMAHKNGYLSASAAEAAGAQGKFWEMYDMLYDKQKDWSDENRAIEIFVTYAKEIGIDADKFRKDVEAKKYDPIIQRDLTDGYELGISATPTFFINEKMYSGVLTYDDFKRTIEEELKFDD